MPSPKSKPLTFSEAAAAGKLSSSDRRLVNLLQAGTADLNGLSEKDYTTLVAEAMFPDSALIPLMVKAQFSDIAAEERDRIINKQLKSFSPQQAQEQQQQQPTLLDSILNSLQQMWSSK